MIRKPWYGGLEAAYDLGSAVHAERQDATQFHVRGWAGGGLHYAVVGEVMSA